MEELGKKVKILSINHGDVEMIRGTPLRVKSLQRYLAKREDIELHTATCNQVLEYSPRHITIDGDRFAIIKTLVQYVKEKDIDVVMCHTITAFLFIIMLRLFTNAKVVLEMHGFFEIEQRETGATNYYQFFRSKILFWLAYRSCHLITTCSDTATNILRKYNRNVVTIWGGVELEYFNPDKKPGSYLSHDGSIIIGYAGNARPYQGLPFLLEAFKEILINNSNFCLALLCSDQVSFDNYRGIQVVPKVPHDKVAHFLAECDILVIPRIHSEVNRISFPSKLLEYMAMGKPVVASRTSDVHEVITHNKDGLLFEPGDTDGFVELILSLSDTEKRRALGSAAFETAKTGYTWQHQTDILVTEIRELFIK